MKKKLLLFFSLLALVSWGQGTITTSPPLTPNNGQSGITFAVSSNTPTEITGISNIFSTGATTASVWVRVGGVNGPPTISVANGWQEVIVNAPLTGANNTSLVAIPFGANVINIPANTPVGIHIAGNTRYQTGTAADVVTYTDGTFTVSTADSVSYGGGLPNPTFNPRRFVGSVTYALGISGGCANLFSNFNIGSIATDSAQINWTPGTGNTGYRIEYGQAGFIPGSGTFVTGTYPANNPPLNISSLIPDTDYDVYFTEYCGTDSVYFPAAQPFTTLPVCPAPSGLSIIALDSVSVTFVYTATTDSLSWEWGPGGFTQGTGTSGTSIGDTITIGGFMPNTNYDLVLTSDCSLRGDGLSRSTTLNFTTDCGYGVARFTENFDGSTFPCLRAFTDVSVGTPVVTITTAFNPTSAPQQLQLNNSSATGSNQDVILYFQPFFGISALNKMVEFNAKTTSTTPTTLDIISIPNADSAGIYNVIQTVTLTTSNQRFTINLDAASNYNGTDATIGFRHGAQNTFQSILIDDVVYDVIPTCLPIDPFTVTTSVGGSDVYLNWASTGSVPGANVQYGTAGFTLGTGTTVATTDTFAIVTGLVDNTLYDFYIQDSCGANDLSVWVGPFSVLTGCSAPLPTNLPFADGFENFSTGPTFNGTTNLCASTYDWRFDASNETASRMRLQAGTTFYRNGTQALTMDHSPSAPAIESNFLTLTVNLTNYTTSGGIELGFYIMSHGQEASPDNRVWVRGNPSNPWVEIVNLDLIRSGNGVYDSVQKLDIVAPLNAAGQSVGALTQIRFGQRGRFSASSINFSDGFTFDDVTLDAVSCPQPSALSISNLFDTTATLNWTGTSSAGQFEYWFGPGGFYQGTTTVGGVKAFANASGILVDTLNAQSCYQFLVRAVCGPGDTSTWAGPFEFCTPCSPISAPYFENWDALATGKDLGCFGKIEDPAFFTSTFAGALVTQFGVPFSGARQIELDNSSSSLPLMIVSPPTTDLTAGDKRVEVRARQSFAAVPPTQLVIGSIANPNDASTFYPLDTFDLTDANPHDRYVTNFTTANGYNGTDAYFAVAHGANATFRTLYVDDLTYEVIPSCPQPSNLTVLAVDSMNATVAFSPFGGSAGNFQIEYGPGGLQGSVLNSLLLVTNDTVNLSSLLSNTNYCFWVREICAPGDTSAWSDPFCFKTQCQAISAPYFNNWDNLSAGNDLGCFIKIEDPSLVSSNFSGLTIQSSTFNQPVSNPNVVEFDNGSPIASPLIMVSPATTDLTASDKRLRFFARSNSVFNLRTLIVGSITNPVDASTFSPLDTLTMTISMLEYIVELTAANGYNGTDQYFAIAHGQNSTFQTIYLDDLNYEVIPSCVRPNALATANITQSTADLSWANANGNTSASYEIEYGLGLLGDPSNTRVIQSAASLNLTGLTAGTGYCFWVREICAPGDSSFWAGPECFSTPCPTSYAAPYFTNFEGITIGIAAGTPAGWENCWTHNTITGSVRWESEDASGANENSTGTGPFYDNTFPSTTGGTYMYLETSTSGGPAELISPGIDISTVSNPELEYHYHLFGATINKLVIYAENATGTRTAIDSLIGAQQAAQADPFVRRAVSLSSLTSGVYKFIFEGHRGTSFTGDISIDDVSVQQGASCARPLSLNTSPISTNSAVARWTPSGSPASYQVEYGSTGFTLGTGTSLTSTADSLVVTFATANNLCQEIYVRAICAPGDTSLWVGPTAICPTAIPCDSIDQYDASLKLYDQSALFVPWAGNAGDVEISTAQSASSPQSFRIHDGGTAGFSDLVALFDTISSGTWEVAFDMYVPTGKGAYFNIQQNYIGGAAGNLWGGEVYFLANGTAQAVYTTGSTLAGSFNYTQGQWNSISTVIDLDNDSIWFELNGSSTTVGYTYSNANAGGPLQFNGVNFYSGVLAGNTYSIEYFVDNFCINPRATACPDPTNLVATANVACDSIELDWTSNSGSSALVYGPSGFNPATGGTTVNNITAPYSVTGLTANTAYDFYVSDICGSDTSNAISITNSTANAPQPVASFTIDSAIVGGSYQVYLDASASTNATSYQWSFGNGSSSSAAIDTMIYSGNGNYTITLIVTNACGSDTATFTTNVNIGLNENALASSLSVYPNPAHQTLNISFREVGSADVQIVLRDAQGRSVLMMNDRMESGTYSNGFDVSDLASGIYMLEIKSGSLTAHRRISIK
ncbi:MAG: hypothetical protein DA405_05640 [Bacteroidetes bacterium]|nr:MAG: hypothetical protein DA405_05640 [Bacteroidota bacterium]